jgi:hypothetical protein
MRLTTTEKELIWDLLMIADNQPQDDNENGEGDYQGFDRKQWNRLHNIIRKFRLDLGRL